MNIYLVRHAQSQSNIDPNILKIKTNMAITLSDVGLIQAQEAGEYLANNLHMPNKEGVKIWNSPYNRTRQTSQAIKDQLTSKNINFTEEETLYVCERQFGLVDDVHDYRKEYLNEAKHYKLHKDSNHDFFARPPLGESPFDMCLRLDFFLKTILSQETEIKNHIIVSHGAAIRGLILMDQKYKYEEYTSANPYNASIRLIQNGEYKGQIFCPGKVTS